jgi:signal transduction histidine kinase
MTVLAGWYSHTPALIQLLPQLPPMTRNTAACFLLCGVALLTLALGGPRLLAVVCAGLVSAVSILRIVEIAFQVNLGISEILGPSYINTRLVTRGGMAPMTAIAFGLASIGLVLSPRVATARSASILGLEGSVVAAFGMAATLGFWGGVTLAAFHTAVGLLVLGVGILALAWHGERDMAGTPRWLPGSVAIAVIAGTLGLWRALFLGGYPPFALLPTVVLTVGCLIAPVFALTVYLAQRGHAQSAALRRSEAFLAEAQHLSRTGSFAWRVPTDEITLSAEVYRIFELDTAVPVTLETINTRVHPDDIPALYEMIARARMEGSDFEYEHRMLMPGGSTKYLHMAAHAARDRDGRLEYVGAIQDVTQRRLSEEALSKARSDLAHVARVTTLGALTASIAHEVNQPLSGIITNASTCLRMLATEPPNVDGARETARRTIRDGNRASEVITRLRALFAKKTAATEWVDLNEATREVIALSGSELQRGRAVVRTELADDLPHVMGDRVQLQQVILNLLLNATDAMRDVEDRPRQLTIRTERDEGDRVRLIVRDAGVGFEMEGIDKLFEAFYTTKSSGMGIGLSVSRSIIDSHQGRLSAAANEGPGATFSFSIPRAAQGATSTHPA